MGIKSKTEYLEFYLGLNMGSDVNLMSFINNEKRVLKLKLESKVYPKEALLLGKKILEELVNEINSIGEEKVIDKYSNFKEGSD